MPATEHELLGGLVLVSCFFFAAVVGVAVGRLSRLPSAEDTNAKERI